MSTPERQRVAELAARLHRDATQAGRTASVLALARAAGIANSTLRRRYPDIVAKLTSTPTAPTSTGTVPAPTGELTRLRSENRDLRQQLNLASAVIQRLTLEAAQLRQQLTPSPCPTARRPAEPHVPGRPWTTSADRR